MGVIKRTRGSIASGVSGVVLAGVVYASFQPSNAETAPQFEDADQVAREIPAAVDGFGGAFPATDAPTEMARSGIDLRAAAADAAKERLRARFDRSLETDPEAQPENGGQFERGYAASLVIADWMCSWEAAYLESRQRGDKESAGRALAQLGTYYDLEYTKQYVQDPSRGWEKQVLRPARLGITRPMAQDYKLSCSDGGES